MQSLLLGLKNLGHIFLIFILLVVGTGFVMWLSIYAEVATGRQKKRFLAIDRYVIKRGYRFINPELHDWAMRLPVFEFAKKLMSENLKQGINGLSQIREFSKGHRAGIEAFAIDIVENEALIFPCTYSGNAGAPGQSTSYVINLKVAKMSRNLESSFRLESKDTPSRVAYWVNQALKTHRQTDSADYIEFADRPRFNQLYYLTSRNESEARKLFSSQMISQLENCNLQGTIVSEPPYLIYFEHGKLSGDQSYDDFIAQAERIFRMILSR